MAVPAVKQNLGDGTIPATLAGLLAHIIVSSITPRPQHSFEEVAEALSRERQAIEEPSLDKAAGAAQVTALVSPHMDADLHS
jgi:hypothetical protein